MGLAGGVRARGVGGRHRGGVLRGVVQRLLLPVQRSGHRQALVGALVDARGRGELCAGVGGGAAVALALEVLDLALEVGGKLVAGDGAGVLCLELLAVQADEEGADVVQQLVDPRHVHQRLVDGDEDEAQLLCLGPLEGVALLAVGGLGARIVRVRLHALLDEDVADEAVDDVGADVGVLARPQHDARRGQDLERVQHCQAGGGWACSVRRAASAAMTSGGGALA